MEYNKLTTWEDEPTIADMNQAVTASLSDYQDRVNKITAWLADLNVEGIPVTKSTGSPKSTVIPKTIRKHAEWRYSSLTEPFHTAESLFKVTPISAKGMDLAEQEHYVLDYQFRHDVPKVKLIDDLIRTLVDEGTAMLKVGWEVETSLTEQEVSMDGFTSEIVEVEVATVNKPTVDILEYDSYLLDPDCKGDISSARYVITKHRTTIHELRKKGYQNLDRLEAVATSNFGTVNNVTEMAFQDKERNTIEVNEYFGYWNTGESSLTPIIITFCQGQIIRAIKSPYPFSELPFVLIKYMPVRNTNMGQPDGYLLKDSQQIGGAITRGIITLLGKSANGQTGYRQNALDGANLLKFQKGEDYVFRADANPNDIVYQHIYPEIPNSAITMLTMQQQEAESLTGINTFGQGLATGSLGDGSAAAANGVMNYASKRESGIIRRIAAGLEQIGKLIIQMNRVFLEPIFVEDITDRVYIPSDTEKYVDCKINIRTAEADEKAAADLAFLLQTIGNTLDPSFTQMIVSEIAKLKGLHALSDKVKTFKPEPDPAVVEQQEIQMELLRVQLANEQAKGELLKAQIISEQEKARKTGADADLINLEFIEEERGVNHERKKELVQVQAQSNMYHTALKAKVEGKKDAK